MSRQMIEPRADDDRPLDELQRWMQSVIMHPLGVAAGAGSAEAQRFGTGAGIDDVILPGPQQTPVERIGVYGNAYFARLLGVLRDSFPALSYALGQDAFDAFAMQYLHRHPSRSYTLGRLADHFVEFLEATRPADESGSDTTSQKNGGSEPGPSWPDFLIDLARLEWTIDQVFDGPGPEGQLMLDAGQLQRIGPEDWASVRLRPARGMRLLEFRYPVNDYYTAFRREEQPELPQPEQNFAAIFRRDYIVRRYKLSAEQHSLLTRLVQGDTLGEAITHCVPEWEGDFERWAGALKSWFRFWASEGFFAALDGEESGDRVEAK